MALPGGLNTITVTGTYTDSFGNPLAGSISFTPCPQIIAPGSQILYAKADAVNLDSAGHFSVVLTCTDNSALLPVGWYYTVVENISGTRSYQFYVPHTLGSTADISDLIPVPTYAGVPAIVPSGNVAPGYGALANTQIWTGNNTFGGTVTFTGTVIGAGSGGGGGGGITLAGDLGGTSSAPTVITTHLAAPLPAAQGGTGASSLAAAGALLAANDLSDVGNPATARTSLGLGAAALLGIGTGSDSVAAGNDSRITGALQSSNSLSDVGSPSTARTNLGLGNSATLNTGTTTGTVATGNDTRITGAVQSSTVTTKGDLLGASGAGTPVRVPVGTDGTLLVAASGQSTGVQWRTLVAADVPTLNQSTTGNSATATTAVNASAAGGITITGAPSTGQVLTATSATAANWQTAPSAPVTSVLGRVGIVTAQSGDYAFSQVSGTAAVTQGGTGQTTQATALTALAGAQTAGRYLRSDGTNTTLTAIQAADVPTLNQSTTGNAGTATSATTAGNITGIAAIANGGSGQSTRQAAINSLTGTQAAGSYLRSDGTNATLASIQAADVPTLNQSTTGNSATATTAGNVTGTVAIAHGGTGATGQQAALTAMAGAQTSGQYLRSNGTNTLLAAIQAADVPTLNQSTTGTAANITGTTALANGGTGQATAAAAITALTGTQTSGQYLRSNGTNAALSTIQAADVPTLNQPTTGTAANVTGVVALANGGTNNSTAPAIGNVPAATSTTASGWVSAAHTGAWVFDPRAYGAVGNGNTVTDGAMTAISATLTCATSTPFTSADVGKVILVKGAGATNPTTLVTTISAYTSSSSVTLAATATTTITGATVMWATDDTVAFQSAINAAVTYAQAHAGYAKVYVAPAAGKFYGIGGALVTGSPTYGNAQLTLPIITPTTNKVTLDIEGAGNGGAVRYWNQTVPLTQGSCLVSFSVFASASAQTTSINANGNPALIGGPTGKQGYGTTNNTYGNLLYSNMQIGLVNLSLVTTHSNAGLTIGAFNFFGVACAYLKNVAYGTAGSVSLGTNGGSAGTNDYAAPGTLATGIAIGGLMPSNGNNDNSQVENVQCLGGYTYGLFASEHTNIHGGCILYCWSGLCVVGIHSDGGIDGVGAIHAVHVSMLSIEACSYHLDIYGSATIGPSITGMLDIEGTINIHDSSSGTSLATAVGNIDLFGSSSAVNITFPTPLVFINQEQFPGAVTTPTFTMGTAKINSFYRRATVYVTTGTGTGITSIQVSSLMGGVTAPTMTTVYSQTSGAMATTFSFRVPPGGWWVINGTTAPTMQWILD